MACIAAAALVEPVAIGDSAMDVAPMTAATVAATTRLAGRRRTGGAACFVNIPAEGYGQKGELMIATLHQASSPLGPLSRWSPPSR